MRSKPRLIGLAASAVMVLASAGIARAQNRDSCARIRRDQQDLERAIDRHGPYSSQAQHERGELQRDSANCGYYGAYGSNDHDADDRWRGDGSRNYGGAYGDRYYGYDRGYYGNGGSYGNVGTYGNYDGGSNYSSAAFDNGYRDGISDSQRDRQKGKAYRPDKNDRYEDADRGYNRDYGDKNLYKSQYRQGFQRGYAEGYGRY